MEQSTRYQPTERHKDIDIQISKLKLEFQSNISGKLPIQQDDLTLAFETFKFENQHVLQECSEVLEHEIDPIQIINDVLEEMILKSIQMENKEKLFELISNQTQAFVQNCPLNIEFNRQEISKYFKTFQNGPCDKALEEIIFAEIGLTNTKLEGLSEHNRAVEDCLWVVRHYVSTMIGYYSVPVDDWNEKEVCSGLLKKIHEKFVGRRSLLKPIFDKTFRDIQAGIAKIDLTLYKSLRDRIQSYENFREFFIQTVRAELNFNVSEVLMMEYLEKIRIEAQKVYEKIFDFKEEAEIIQKFGDQFELYYKQKKIDIFDDKYCNNDLREEIFTILICADYGIRDEKLWDDHCYTKLQKLIQSFIASGKITRKQFLHWVLDDVKKLGADRYEVQSKLEESKQNWKQMIKNSEEMFYHTLFSIFIYFSNSRRNEKNQSYRSYYRKMIIRAFRCFLDGGKSISHQRMLHILEQLYEEFRSKGTKCWDMGDMKEAVKLLSKEGG